MAGDTMLESKRIYIIEHQLTPKEELVPQIPTPPIEPIGNTNNTIPTLPFSTSAEKENFFQPSKANIKRFL